MKMLHDYSAKLSVNLRGIFRYWYS